MKSMPARLRFFDVLAVLVCVLAVAVGVFMRSKEPPDPAFERVQETGKLIVAMDATYPPFGFIADGQFQGFDVDLARAIGDYLEVSTEFESMAYDGLNDALASRKVDVIISALAPVPEYMNDYWYSRPYLNAGQVFVTRGGWVPDPSKSDSFDGKRLGVELGTYADTMARQIERRSPGLALTSSYHSAEEAAADLRAGALDGIMADAVTAAGLKKRFPELRVSDPPMTDEPYVVAVKAGSPRMLAKINALLNQMSASGELKRLAERWF